MFDASTIIGEMRQALAGDPVYLAGSLVAAEAYDLPHAWNDVDLFCPTDHVLIATIQKLLHEDFKLDEKFERVWQRWLRYGFKKWHTNSIRMHSPSGTEINLVYKLTDGHPTTSLSQVLESFDFGLLGVGYDLERNVKGDLREFLFPGWDPAGPLPLMPNKRSNWRNGFISQYNGLREAGRYAKYHGYGYDLSEVKDDLVTGYWAAAAYHGNAFEDEKRKLGEIYETIAVKIEDDAIDELLEAYKVLDFKDSLDQIMEALE